MFRILESFTFMTEASVKYVVQGKIVTFRIIIIIRTLSKLKEDKLNFLLEKPYLKSSGFRLENKSKERKDSEVKHEAPVRKSKLSIQFDGKVVYLNCAV